MKKLLIILILLFGSLVLIGVIGANFFLDLFCRQALVLIPKYSAEFGMQMIEPKYDQVRFASPRKVSWYNAKVMLRPSFQGEFTARKFFDFRAGEISLETADFSFERFRVVGRNADIRYTRAATAAFLDEKSALGENWDVGKLQGESFAIDINFNFRKPFAGIREMIGQVKELLSAGRVEAGISWKGRYTLVVGPNTEHWVGVQIEQIGNESVINLNQNDLRALSQYFDRLTDAQIEIVRHHPHQASALVKIQFDAEKTAREQFQADSSVPLYVYRAALFSFFLTQQMGANFAKQVTDADQSSFAKEEEFRRPIEQRASQEGRKYAMAGADFHALINELRKASVGARAGRR